MTTNFATILDWRAALVAEALSWRGTRFAHGQCLKGFAADCSTFPSACYHSVGLFHAEIPHLPPDWFLHKDREFYLEELRRHASEFTLEEHTPQPGDFMVIRDPCAGPKSPYSHGSIVVQWAPVPEVIHCFPRCGGGVMVSNPRRNPAFVGKPAKFFDPFAPAAARQRASGGPR